MLCINYVIVHPIKNDCFPFLSKVSEQRGRQRCPNKQLCICGGGANLKENTKLCGCQQILIKWLIKMNAFNSRE